MHFRPSQSDDDDDMMRQRFVDEFRLYEDRLFKSADRKHFHRHRPNDTLGNLYFRITESMCTTMVMCMTRFHAQEIAAIAPPITSKGGEKVPLSTVHALYKMMEYYVPVYDDMSYDVDLLCTVCKVRAVYRPCTRLSKKSCCQRFNSRCLQCCVEHEVTAGRGNTRLLDIFRYSTNELECRCHRNYLCLLFPSFVLFASESSRKMVMRMCVKWTLADMMSKTGDSSAMIRRIDSRIADRGGSSSVRGGDSSTQERKQYVDRQYLYTLVSEYATDHFMICGGICSELRGILRISGISNKMYDVVTLLSMSIGQSSLLAAPSGDVVGESQYLQCGGRHEYAAEDGEHFIGRMRYRLRMTTCCVDEYKRRQEESTDDTKLRQQHYSYCPSCHVAVSTIMTMVPEICKPDSMYDISRRQGIYNTDVTRRQAERTQKKKKQQISNVLL